MKVELDEAEIAKLDRLPGVQAELGRRARIVLNAARVNPPFLTGTYAAGLRLRRVRGAHPHYVVNADDRKAMWLEYGTGTPAPTPYFEVLTRAAGKGRFSRIDFDPHIRKGRRG
jgi:hypothetical protein